MTKFQLRVKEFMRKAGQEAPDVIGTPPIEKRILRARLLLEEVLEYIEAAGVDVMMEDLYEMSSNKLTMEDLKFVESNRHPDLPEMLDGLSDINFVSAGGQIEIGIDPEIFDNEVCDSNDSKFIDGYKDPITGKWKKGKSFVEPRIKELLDWEISKQNKKGKVEQLQFEF